MTHALDGNMITLNRHLAEREADSDLEDLIAERLEDLRCDYAPEDYEDLIERIEGMSLADRARDILGDDDM